MGLEVKSLSQAERKRFSGFIVGVTTCPTCKRDDIKVVNDHGAKGSRMMDYLEDHTVGGNACTASEAMVKDF